MNPFHYYICPICEGELVSRSFGAGVEPTYCEECDYDSDNPSIIPQGNGEFLHEDSTVVNKGILHQ